MRRYYLTLTRNKQVTIEVEGPLVPGGGYRYWIMDFGQHYYNPEDVAILHKHLESLPASRPAVCPTLPT